MGSLIQDASHLAIDIPLIETPVSVQVIPQTLILDKQLSTLPDAVTGQVSGVIGRTGGGILYDNFIIRGFAGSDFGDAYRNGLYNRQDIYDIANVERVEVLKAPAAVLYGRIEPGGLVNYVTKKPLATPRYTVEQQAGSNQQFRTLLDATGPIAGNSKVLYRFNGSYFSTESFRDFVSNGRAFIAPSLTWKPSSRFDVTAELEYKRDD
jgi:iron complex outermembrane recepter protein